MAGVIDADYRGQVGVILANLSETDFSIKVGDRIAQLIVEKVCTFPLDGFLRCAQMLCEGFTFFDSVMFLRLRCTSIETTKLIR
jgi:dUTPase